MNACQTVLRGAREVEDQVTMDFHFLAESLDHPLVLFLVHFSGLKHWSKWQCPQNNAPNSHVCNDLHACPYQQFCSFPSFVVYSHWISIIGSNLFLHVTAIYCPPISPHKTKCVCAGGSICATQHQKGQCNRAPWPLCIVMTYLDLHSPGKAGGANPM